MASNFSLRDALARGGAVPNLDTGDRERIEYIPLTDLRSDERNFYELSGIEELAANIELLGLQQPIRVRRDPDKAGGYVIVSGHRRRAALEKLAEEGKERFREVPCIVERSEGSAAFQELRLIYANSDTRKMSNAEIAKQAARVTELFYILKEEGVEFPGRMRDHVAEACQISKSKLARLEVIRKSLIPEHMDRFEDGTMPEVTAYTMARFPADFQRRLFGALKNMPDGHSLGRILEQYEAGKRWEPDMTCPDGTACKRGDAFLRHDMENRWDHCGGETCCLECRKATTSTYPCERACSKAKALKKDRLEHEREEMMEKERAQQQEIRNKIQRSAQRLVKAIDRAGLPEDATITPQNYQKKWTVKELREAAEGRFGDLHFYGNAFDPGRFDKVLDVAKQLGCTTDYLLELSDTIAPQEQPEGQPIFNGWMPGGTNPAEPCDAVACFDAGDGVIFKRLVRWNGKAFTFPSGGGIDMETVKWMALPPD